MISIPIFLLCRQRFSSVDRVKSLPVALAVCGLGSIAFHVTQTHHAEMLDELPMIALMACYIYCQEGLIHSISTLLIHRVA